MNGHHEGLLFLNGREVFFFCCQPEAEQRKGCTDGKKTEEIKPDDASGFIKN